jgi:PAS domain S-box-containing protein
MDAEYLKRAGQAIRQNGDAILVAALVGAGLFLVGLYRYLLFHALVELFSIVIAFTVFVLTWNARKILNNGYLLFLGIALLFVGGLDLLHTLAFRGMGVLPGTGMEDPGAPNLATQLWLAARYLQSITLIVAPFFAWRSYSPRRLLWAYSGVTVLLLLSIFGWGIFPTAYTDRLTPFKVASEYVIIFFFLAGGALLLPVQKAFPPAVLRLLLASMAVNVVAEFAFTGYQGVTDFMNMAGHLLKVLSFALVYKAIIETGFRSPQELLYRELAESEQALREISARERARAAQLQAVMDAVPAVVWIAHDPDARFITGNLAASQILRMPASANLSKTAPDNQAPTHFKVFKDGTEMPPEALPLQVSAASGKPVRDFEEKIVFDDGEERTLLGNVTPLLDEEGLPAGAVAAFIDITSRVAVEQALQESEQHYRSLFESMEEGFVLLEILPDTQGHPYDYRILEVNPAFERMTGLRREQMAGQTMRVWLPDAPAEWLGYFDKAARTGEAQRFEIYAEQTDQTYEIVLYRARPDQIAALTIDITVRRHGEQALRLSEARLRRLVESNIIGVVYATADGQITVANDAFLQIVGYSRADFAAGQVNWKEMTPPEFARVDARGIEEANRRGACTPYEKEYYRKDGSRVAVLIGYAYFNEPGNPYICFVIDLTEQKRAEAAVKEYATQLEQSNRELQDFAFVASHDLQEPLRKIQAFGERLKERLHENLDDESDDYLVRMLNASQRMRNMINDLLSLSRVTTRGQPFERVDLNQVAQEVLSDLELRIERTGGKVDVDALPVIEADPVQMQQLFQNLIVNALKFHQPASPPRVRLFSQCLPETRQVQVFVEDNGIGFEEQYLDRIFQPFQRLHGRAEYEGSGIGLAVCRKITERHGGTITARSAVGQGSTFIVTLPEYRPSGGKDGYERQR